jgi:hypothetical protein
VERVPLRQAMLDCATLTVRSVFSQCVILISVSESVIQDSCHLHDVCVRVCVWARPRPIPMFDPWGHPLCWIENIDMLYFTSA